MRRFNIVAALVAGALLAGHAKAATYVWDGGSSSTSSWQTSSNWRNDTVPPLTGGHDIYIRAADLVGSTATANWDYGSSSTASYGLFSLVADSTTGMTLQKSGAGSFTAKGRLSMTGYSSTRLATLDADANMTVTGITVQSYGAIDVASSVTVTNNGSFTIDALTGYSQCAKTGPGSLVCGATSLLAGNANGEDAYLVISAGTFTGGAALVGSKLVNAKAAIQVAGGTLDADASDLKLSGGPTTAGLALLDFDSGTLSANTLDMRGLSKIDAEDSFSVGAFSVSVDTGDTFATEATVDVALDEVISVETIVIGDSQACKLIVLAGGSDFVLVTDGTP